MTYRPLTLITAVSLAGLAIFLGVLQALFAAAPPARALSGDGHGPGYSSSDGWWLGAYHFDDGALGFCLNPGKLHPTGVQYSYADSSALGWWSPAQSAVFAYIARTWAGTGDRQTAAAAQVATWMNSDMSETDARAHAARAGADAEAVYARAVQMLEEARGKASTGARLDAVVELAETGPGRLRIEVTVDRLSGPELLPAGAHNVDVTLTGASFADGEDTRTVSTGADVDIVPTGTEVNVSVTAAATARDLPYGNRLTVAVPGIDAQAVLIAQPATVTSEAQASATGPSPLPFQPRVETQTTAPQAKPGAQIADHLAVTVDPAAGLLPAWGVRSAASGFEPIAATVSSTLYGPFSEPIALADKPPAGSPEVCTVDTVVNGVGDYTTPPCTVPRDGYYVWAERIDPSRTAPDQGGARLRPWESRFGVATEITRVSSPPKAAPTAQLAQTGTDVTQPALWSAGAMLGGAALTTASGIRRRRRGTVGPRRARSSWIHL